MFKNLPLIFEALMKKNYSKYEFLFKTLERVCEKFWTKKKKKKKKKNSYQYLSKIKCKENQSLSLNIIFIKNYLIIWFAFNLNTNMFQSHNKTIILIFRKSI